MVTATEEFGIAAVEALAAGRPVIALGEGGVRESVVEGVTGTFFERREPDALAAAVRAFDPLGRRSGGVPGRRRALRRRAVPRASSRRIVAEAVRDERPLRPGDRAAARGLAALPGRRTARRAAMHG